MNAQFVSIENMKKKPNEIKELLHFNRVNLFPFNSMRWRWDVDNVVVMLELEKIVLAKSG